MLAGLVLWIHTRLYFSAQAPLTQMWYFSYSVVVIAFFYFTAIRERSRFVPESFMKGYTGKLQAMVLDAGGC